MVRLYWNFMRLLLLCLCLLGPAGVRGGSLGASPEEYRSRRENLAKALPDGLTVLFGRTEKDSDDLRTAFFQEPNFFYLTGWNEPGAVLLIEPRAQGAPREVLFLPKRNETQEKWTGRKVAPGDEDVRTATGFDVVLPLASLEVEVKSSLERAYRIYTVGDAATASLKALAPLRDVATATKAIARLRMVKSEYELELLQRAADASMEAQQVAWKRAAPGLYEYQIAAAMTGIYFDRGCERSAYAPIIGSGPNSTVLHYSRNSRRMDRGELLLLDVGAECGGYAADITRTIPVGAKFSARQREIYEIVLGAQQAALAAVKPGAVIAKNAPGSLYQIAYDYINSHGKDQHGETLGKYFIHGLSHHVGLEVHDAWDPEMPLQEGMVITIEPGIYLPEEGIGVRIEDMVLVTKDGGRLLTGALPRDAAAIEKAIRQ